MRISSRLAIVSFSAGIICAIGALVIPPHKLKQDVVSFALLAGNVGCLLGLMRRNRKRSQPRTGIEENYWSPGILAFRSTRHRDRIIDEWFDQQGLLVRRVITQFRPVNWQAAPEWEAIVMEEHFATITTDRNRSRMSVCISRDVRTEQHRRAPATQQPEACCGCRHYHGQVYNQTFFCCGMYPYGPELEECSDWEGLSQELSQ